MLHTMFLHTDMFLHMHIILSQSTHTQIIVHASSLVFKVQYGGLRPSALLFSVPYVVSLPETKYTHEHKLK
jgi:hypothetical protein